MEKAAIIAARRRNITSVLLEDLFGYSLLGESSVSENKLAHYVDEIPEYLFLG